MLEMLSLKVQAIFFNQDHNYLHNIQIPGYSSVVDKEVYS